MDVGIRNNQSQTKAGRQVRQGAQQRPEVVGELTAADI